MTLFRVCECLSLLFSLLCALRRLPSRIYPLSLSLHLSSSLSCRYRRSEIRPLRALFEVLHYCRYGISRKSLWVVWPLRCSNITTSLTEKESLAITLSVIIPLVSIPVVWDSSSSIGTLSSFYTRRYRFSWRGLWGIRPSGVHPLIKGEEHHDGMDKRCP